MRLATRSIAFAVVVSLLGSGPLSTFARAQQPAQPPAEQPAPQPEQPAQPAEQAAPQPAEQPAQAPPPPMQPAEQPAQAAPQPAPQPAAQPQPAQMPAPTAAGEPQVVQEPVTFEVRGNVVAAPARDLVPISHAAVRGLAMGAMELVAIAAEPALLDAVGPTPGDRVRLDVRATGDRLVLLRIERIP